MTKKQLIESIEANHPDLKRAYDSVTMLETQHKVSPGTYGSQAILDTYRDYLEVKHGR